MICSCEKCKSRMKKGKCFICGISFEKGHPKNVLCGGCSIFIQTYITDSFRLRRVINYIKIHNPVYLELFRKLIEEENENES